MAMRNMSVAMQPPTNQDRDPTTTAQPAWNARRAPWAQSFRAMVNYLTTPPARSINNPSYASQMCRGYTQPIQNFAGLATAQALYAPENQQGLRAWLGASIQPSVKNPQPSAPIQTSMPWDNL